MTKLIKYITLAEFDLLMKSCKSKETKLAMLLGFGSGLRISEIIGYKRKNGTEVKPLAPENIDLQAHQIRVVSGKGDKDRIVPTPPNFNETHLKMLPLVIYRRTLQKRIETLGLKVLNKKLTFHQFRHGFANFMVNEKNIPLPMVQQILGHSRLDTTGIYTKSNPKQAIESAWKAWGI